MRNKFIAEIFTPYGIKIDEVDFFLENKIINELDSLVCIDKISDKFFDLYKIEKVKKQKNFFIITVESKNQTGLYNYFIVKFKKEDT